MMNIRQRSVNVNRLELLTALKANLIKHQAEYQEALVEFKTRLLADLNEGVKHVETASAEELKKFHVSINYPQNHEKDYQEVIEMLEMSVDETINLDAESFRAYIKNEWSWSGHFESVKATYALAGSMLNR